MTWVKGQTTWANLASDLTKLACGEIADSVSTTVAVGDRWVREYDTTSDNIRSPASRDVASGTLSMRVGYWALGSCQTNGNGYSTYCRQRSIKTGLSARQGYRIVTATTNSAANDYSTASVRIYAWDLDTSQFIRSGNTFALAADGSLTTDNMTIQFGDPSGFLPTNLEFIRHFTTTYPGGIDWWPMYYRRSATATWGATPPGVDGTDYAICEHAYAYPWDSNGSGYGGAFAQYAGNGPGTGLGIKTATALGTNPVYTLSFPMALHKIHIFPAATAGVLSLRVGGRTVTDTVVSVGRNVGGLTHVNWMKMFSTPAQVVSGAVISYWMSVKADGIMIVLSADPGLTGKTACGWVGVFTPYDTTYDVFPTAHNQQWTDFVSMQSVPYAFDSAKQYCYWTLRKRQDGTEGSRDWQTKWMRCDLTLLGTMWSGTYYAADPTWTDTRLYAWGMNTYYSVNSGDGRSLVPPRQLKPHPIDGKWWLYGTPVADVDAWTTATTAASTGTMDQRFLRGVANTRWWALPGDGWANLDELTDNSNGNKYFLVAADYHGIGGRWQNSNSTAIGGVAIAEV